MVLHELERVEWRVCIKRKKEGEKKYITYSRNYTVIAYERAISEAEKLWYHAFTYSKTVITCCPIIIILQSEVFRVKRQSVVFLLFQNPISPIRNCIHPVPSLVILYIYIYFFFCTDGKAHRRRISRLFDFRFQIVDSAALRGKQDALFEVESRRMGK